MVLLWDLSSLQECPQSLFKLLMFQDLNKHIMADGSGADGVDIWSTLAKRWYMYLVNFSKSQGQYSARRTRPKRSVDVLGSAKMSWRWVVGPKGGEGTVGRVGGGAQLGSCLPTSRGHQGAQMTVIRVWWTSDLWYTRIMGKLRILYTKQIYWVRGSIVYFFKSLTQILTSNNWN